MRNEIREWPSRKALARLVLVGLLAIPLAFSCEDPACHDKSANQATPVAADLGPQGCRDHIVDCESNVSCPYAGQKIETTVGERADGCGKRSICVCRCPSESSPSDSAPVAP